MRASRGNHIHFEIKAPLSRHECIENIINATLINFNVLIDKRAIRAIINCYFGQHCSLLNNKNYSCFRYLNYFFIFYIFVIIIATWFCCVCRQVRKVKKPQTARRKRELIHHLQINWSDFFYWNFFYLRFGLRSENFNFKFNFVTFLAFFRSKF